jgi:hypothetical protein
LSLTQKWVVKPIDNKSDNTLKKDEHYISRKVSTTVQEMDYKKIMKDQVERIERS